MALVLVAHSLASVLPLCACTIDSRSYIRRPWLRPASARIRRRLRRTCATAATAVAWTAGTTRTILNARADGDYPRLQLGAIVRFRTALLRNFVRCVWMDSLDARVLVCGTIPTPSLALNVLGIFGGFCCCGVLCVVRACVLACPFRCFSAQPGSIVRPLLLCVERVTARVDGARMRHGTNDTRNRQTSPLHPPSTIGKRAALCSESAQSQAQSAAIAPTLVT